jgi:hypothetical protein
MTGTGHGGMMKIEQKLIATICVIQAMNVFLIPQWERNGMTLSHKPLMRRYRLLNVHLGTNDKESFLPTSLTRFPRQKHLYRREIN